MWHREMGGLHLPASIDPRCIVSLQVRFQLDETTGKTHTFSTVPESVEAKRRLLLIEARAAGQLAGDQQPLF